MSFDNDVDELVLYADNDSNLYRQRDAFLKNMARKMKKGGYDRSKGVKLWTYFADRAAKQYSSDGKRLRVNSKVALTKN